MTRIHVTYAGGTIGMIEGDQGLEPGTDLPRWLRRFAAARGISANDLTVSALDPLIDSANATPASWQAIVDNVRTHRATADAFVVLHGTDTMAYTASALSYALAGLPQPIIMTGAQRPLTSDESDAPANVAGALRAAVAIGTSGVFIFFGGRLLQGNRAVKVSASALQAFDSPVVPPLTEAEEAGAGPLSKVSGRGWPSPQPFTCPDIAVLDMVPGLYTARIQALLAPLPDAVLVRAYGSGNISDNDPGITRLLATCTAQGVPVVVTSQCLASSVALGRYRTGAALARAGAIGAGNMTFEAAYAKLVFLLAQGLDAAGVAQWMPRSIAGEVAEAQ